MPIGGPRLSAVARQRRLRADQQGFDPVSDISSPTQNSQVNQTPLEPYVANAAQGKLQAVSTTKDDAPPNENQFESLSNSANGKRQDYSIRQIERLNQSSTRVKLSKGQRCVILGLCSVWVKDGEVSIYGAVLSASVQIHRLFAPMSHALPYVEALSGQAEFQLDSIDDGIDLIPDLGLGNLWKPPRKLNQHEQSYFIFGDSFNFDFDFGLNLNFKSSHALRELDLTPLESVLQDLTRFSTAHGTTSGCTAKADTDSVARRILICGRQPSDLSTFARCIINRMLTRRQSTRKSQGSCGIILLDLNHAVSEMTPPGTVGLIHATSPLLGPNFTHTSTVQPQTNKILKMHFVGDVDSVSISDWWRECVYDLVTHSEGKRLAREGCDLVVNAPTWLASAGLKFMDMIWQKLALTDIVCFDQNSSFTQPQFLQPFAKSNGCSVHFLHGLPGHRLAPIWEHNIHMQSYFHLNDYQSTRPRWNYPPVRIGGQHEVVLRFAGEEADISATIVLSSEIALEDTFDALENALVGIISVGDSLVDRSAHEESTIEHDIETWSSQLHENNAANDSNTVCLQWSEAENIPRLMVRAENLYPLQAKSSECIGLGIVTSIDVEASLVTMITPIPKAFINNLMTIGRKLVLVIPKATTDGRFKTDWTWRETASVPFKTNLRDASAFGDDIDEDPIYESSDSNSDENGQV